MMRQVLTSSKRKKSHDRTYSNNDVSRCGTTMNGGYCHLPFPPHARVSCLVDGPNVYDPFSSVPFISCRFKLLELSKRYRVHMQLTGQLATAWSTSGVLLWLKVLARLDSNMRKELGDKFTHCDDYDDTEIEKSVRLWLTKFGRLVL